MVFREVRGRRQLEADVAICQSGQDLRVADVLPGAEGAGRDAERESPRGEAVTLRNRGTDEPVSFENRVGEPKVPLPVRHDGTRLEAARRDRHVVSGRRHTGHLVEFETFGHRIFSGPVRSLWHGGGHYRGNGGLGQSEGIEDDTGPVPAQHGRSAAAALG